MVNIRGRRARPAEAVEPVALPEPVDSRQQMFDGFVALGLTPAKALSELVRLGVLDGHEAGHLTRPWDVWEMALREVLPGHVLVNYVAAATRDRRISGRVLADWCVLQQVELDWLAQLADGSATTPDLSAEDAADILRIQAESRAEQAAAGEVEYAVMTGRTVHPCRPGWWWGSGSPLRRFAVEG